MKFDTGRFTQVVVGVYVWFVVSCCNTLREAQIDLGLIYQEMAHARKLHRIIVYSICRMFNRI
jgi:hypothetical protein